MNLARIHTHTHTHTQVEFVSLSIYIPPKTWNNDKLRENFETNLCNQVNTGVYVCIVECITRGGIWHEESGRYVCMYVRFVLVFAVCIYVHMYICTYACMYLNRLCVVLEFLYACMHE
jgi:hypothetical protein